MLRPCPGGDAPTSLCLLQRYCKTGSGFLNGFPMLLVGIGRWRDKIRAVSGNIDGPRRPQRGVPVRNPVLLVVRIQCFPPIRACRRAMPLVRRKFIENRHVRVAHCQRRFQLVFIQVIEVPMHRRNYVGLLRGKSRTCADTEGEYDGQTRHRKTFEVHIASSVGNMVMIVKSVAESTLVKGRESTYPRSVTNEGRVSRKVIPDPGLRLIAT